MIDKTLAGSRIAMLRKELGYSQAVFAEKLGVSAQAVSKWETGLALPDIETLLNISWLTEASLHTILEGEDFIGSRNNADRGLLRISRLLVCPQCHEKLDLQLPVKQNKLSLCCKNGHTYELIDGVIHFGSREIPGELWSLVFSNYEHYLMEQHYQGNPRYLQGDPNSRELMWRQIEKLRPRTILDIACGTGYGIKYIIERINWPVTIIMTDLSHRVLKYNRIFFSEEWKNPYVDIVYLACDCSSLPLADNCIDVVFSNAGFESMQAKMMDGFHEAYRVLKPGGHAVYNMSVIEDHNSENTQKWLKLYNSLDHNDFYTYELFEISQWLEKCRKSGFNQNETIKVYDELPAPGGDIFPFENEILQWMAAYVITSQKSNTPQ